MSLDIAGSVAFVTAAGSGIGRASAISFARRGANVVVSDIDEDRARAVASEIGDAGVACRCDVTDTADLEQITFYGEATQPRGPNFGLIEADQAGEIVADGVEAGKFLLLTTDEPAAELRARGADVDAYIYRVIEEYR